MIPAKFRKDISSNEKFSKQTLIPIVQFVRYRQKLRD